ncbi:MAG: hypothetical protein K2Y71_05255 [Xanthobacteraceae bacterium]|nr:hypothetical protein [Xanthobacteraceae bacterium]
MGLDIYHAQAKREVDVNFFRIDGMASDEFRSLQPYVQVHQNPHTDWEKMFSDQGLVYGNYRAVVRATDGRRNCFAFVDADAVGFEAPIRVIFSDEWQFPLLPRFMQRSKFNVPGSKKAPHFFGPFATIMKSENVVFYDIVGYQRNGVSDDFYQCFRPDDVTCLENRVEGIYQMTAPELREEFKRTFMNNWIDGRSFVIISY